MAAGKSTTSQKPDGRRVRRATVLALGIVLGVAASVAVSAENRMAAGLITFVDPHAVEVAGVRGRKTPDSTVMSEGRAVSWGSLQRGRPASIEIDTAGRLIELNVGKVLE